MSREELDEAEVRRAYLLAACEQTCGGNHSELHRRLLHADPRLALSTVQNWCRGESSISALTLYGVLVTLGLPHTWTPAPWANPMLRTGWKAGTKLKKSLVASP